MFRATLCVDWPSMCKSCLVATSLCGVSFLAAFHNFFLRVFVGFVEPRNRNDWRPVSFAGVFFSVIQK
jgi:hypothetical protein